jgi:thymidylate kinase
MGKYIIKDKLLVEFVGLPGSGKTTIASGVMDSLSSLGLSYNTRESLSLPKHSKINRYIYSIFFVIRHPLLVLRIFNLSSGFKSFYKLLKNFISQYRAVRKSKLLSIYDQGMLNTVFYFNNKKMDWSSLNKIYSKLIPSKKTLVVFIESDFDTAIKRANNRPAKNHFTEHMNQGEILDIFSNYAKNYKYFLQNSKDLKLLTISNKDEVSFNVENIVKLIKELLDD